MAVTNSNDIKIKIELQDRLTAVKKSFQSLKDQNGFTNKAESAGKITSNITQIDALLAKEGSLTVQELRKIRSLFHSTANFMNDASATISKITEEAKKLQEKQNKTAERRQKYIDQRDELFSKYSTNKEQTQIKDFRNTSLSGYGWLSKNNKFMPIAPNVDSLRKAVEKHPEALQYKDPKTGTITSKTATDVQKVITDADNELKQAQQNLNNLNKKIIELDVQITKLTNDFQAQTQKDIAQGKTTDTGLINQITQNNTQTEEFLNTEIAQRLKEDTDKDVNDRMVEFNKNTKETTTTLGQALKRFSALAIILRTLRSAANEARATIKELDKSLTDQAMVTGKSRSETYKLLTTYQEMAKSLGSTSKEIAEVATEYMRQGKTTQEALTLTQAAVSSAKVAAISATESVNYLTTALNGFQLSAEQAMKVSDKFASIAATSATSYEEIAVALSKVASQANLAGMSIDYTTALLAKGIETTREAPETIGTALKTVIARMREITDYGETLSGDTDVNNVETQLAYVGIALKDANGELRSTEDVLDDLGKKWDTLNSNQQAAVAKALAGTRQQSRLIAMMSDYERVTELQEVAQRSSGATMAQMEKYTDSIEAATNRITASWEEIISTVTNSEVITSILNQFAKALETINNTVLLQGNGWEQFAGTIILAAVGIKGLTAAMGKLNENAIAKHFGTEEKQRNIQNAQSELGVAKTQALTQENLNDFMNNATGIQNQEIVQEYKEASKAYIEADKDVTAAKAEQDQAQAELDQALKEQEATLAENNAEIVAATEQEKTDAISRTNLEKEEGILLDNKQDTTAIKNEQVQAEQKLADTTQKTNSIKVKAEETQTAAAKKVASAQEKVKAATEKVTKAEATRNKQQERFSKAETALKQAAITNNKQVQQAQEKLNYLQSQANQLTIISQALLLAKNVILGINNGLQAYANLLLKFNKKAQTEDAAATTANTAAQYSLATGIKAVNAAFAANPIGAVVTGILAATVALTALLVVLSQFGAFESGASKAADKVNALSAEIYTLNEKATKLDNIIDSFDAIDEKVLKTTSDLEEMNTLLDEAGNSLSTETNGKDSESEQSEYNKLTTSKAKYEYLTAAKQRAQDQTELKRLEQLKLVNSLNTQDLETFMTSSEAKYVQGRDAIYATNNSRLYDYVDILKETNKYTDEQLSAIESVTTAMLEQIDGYQALEYANNPEKIKKITNAFAELTTTIDGETVSLVEMLDSSDYGLKDQVQAFEQIQDALAFDKDALKAFQDTYSQYEVFAKMSDDVLDFVDKAGISVDELNDIYIGYKRLQKIGVEITKDEYQDRFDDFLQSLADFDGDIAKATEYVFGDILSQFEKGSEEYIEAWNMFIDIFGNTVTTGILNMGQDIDKFNNQIDSIYEKATSWNTLSETERSEFLQDNYELFQGSDGDKLLKAFESGNYNLIESALKTNKTILENRQDLLDQVEQELKVELAREGDDYNAAYIKQLQEYKNMLEDQNTLYRASLETRLEQQQNAIDQYKSMLEQEKNALTDSLDKRKEAYSKYFDAVNQEADDQDYEEQATLLQTNIAKLASSTNASSVSQMKELQKSLEDLEKERLNTLRERAQEALTQAIEDEVSDINTKFDELLEDQQALLNALTSDSSTSQASLLAKLISEQVAAEGLTAVGLEDYLNTLQSTLGNFLSDVDWNNLSTSTSENNNLVLNIAGQEVELNSQDQQNMYDIIMQALKQLGLK